MSVSYNTDRRYWYVDSSWPDGIRTRAKMPDKETAVRINKKIEAAIVDEPRIWQKLRRELRLEQQGVCSFTSFADHYFDQYVRSYNRDTRVKKSRIEVLKSYFGAASFESVSLQAVGAFVASRKRDGVKNATINRYLSLLHHMAEWAVGQGILQENPLARLQKLDEPEWIGMRPDEGIIDTIFEQLDSRVLPTFAFIRDTGCRKGEAIALRGTQVDFARQEVVFVETKSGKVRHVPLTDKGLWAVSALPKHGATVFYHPEWLKPWTGDGLSVYWEKARAAAGYPEIRIHDIRHAYGIKLAEAGCPMHYISEVMGHHSIDFTRKKYARFSPESATRAVLRVLQGKKASGGRKR